MASTEITRIIGESNEFGRTVVVGNPRNTRSKVVYAVCVKTHDPEELTISKLYRVKINGEFARVIDDQGEANVCPSDFFVELPLSKTTRNQIEAALSL